jgi:hypothetical protein
LLFIILFRYLEVSKVIIGSFLCCIYCQHAYSMKIYNFGMSDWLLFHTNSVIIQLNHGEHKYNFQWDDGEIRFLLDKHASWIFVVPAQWNNRPRIDMSLHSTRYPDSKPTSWTQPVLEHRMYRTRCKNANRYTTMLLYIALVLRVKSNRHILENEDLVLLFNSPKDFQNEYCEMVWQKHIIKLSLYCLCLEYRVTCTCALRWYKLKTKESKPHR